MYHHDYRKIKKIYYYKIKQRKKKSNEFVLPKTETDNVINIEKNSVCWKIDSIVVMLNSENLNN